LNSGKAKEQFGTRLENLTSLALTRYTRSEDSLLSRYPFKPFKPYLSREIIPIGPLY
jgi:hypothetical protein